MPRDMFPGARVGSAVIFARKSKTPDERRPVYRWVNARKPNRVAFLEDGRTCFKALMPVRPDGDPLTSGPVDELPRSSHESAKLRSVVRARSGLVKEEDSILPAEPFHENSVPVNCHGAGNMVYRTMTHDFTTWADINSPFFTTVGAKETLEQSPKLLIQSHCNPDVPWRIRPVLDEIGLVPADGWHAIFPADLETAYALLTVLSSSFASVWIHSRAATKRIPKNVLLDLPLPPNFDRHKPQLRDLGHSLATLGPSGALMQEIETKVDSLYGLTASEAKARDQVVSGFRAPEKSIRIDRTSLDSIDQLEATDRPRSGAVLDIENSLLRVWTVDSASDDGILAEIPELMPGWLAAPGSTFDLRGSIAGGSYGFHRSSHLSARKEQGPDGNSIM